MKLIPLQKYEIFWIDIETKNDIWYELEDIKKDMKKKLVLFKNTGYYIGQSRHYYYFTSGIANDGDYFDYVKFPKGVVKRIRKI